MTASAPQPSNPSSAPQSVSPLATAAPATTPPATAPPTTTPPTAHRQWGHSRWWKLVLVILIVAACGYFFVRWYAFRATHSITDDAFVEAHIVNISPELVSGRLVRMLVEENDRV